MKIEIFELQYLQFILSTIWNFLGSVIILMIITGAGRRVTNSVKTYFANKYNQIKQIYKARQLAEQLRRKTPEK